MPATKAERNRQKAPAKNRYNAKTYKTIAFRLRQDGSDGITADIIKQAAEAAGMSVNAWIIQAIKDKL
jgi:predicted HicB family RNase H-like nuclease